MLYLKKYRKIAVALIILIVFAVCLMCASANRSLNSMWKEDNTLQEDLLNLQNKEGYFYTEVNRNPLYRTYYSVLALKIIEEELALDRKDFVLTKTWIENLESTDVIKDSTPITDIYYYYQCADLVGAEVPDEMKAAIMEKLRELYRTEGFFTYETDDLTVRQNQLKDATNRSMTLLAIEVLQMMDYSDIYNEALLQQNIEEAISVYSEELLVASDIDVILLSNILTLLEIADLLEENFLTNRVELSEKIVAWQEKVKGQPCDELMLYYNWSTYLKLADKLSLEVDKEWINSSVGDLIKSNDIYILAHTLKIIQQFDLEVDENKLIQIKKNIVSGLQYNGTYSLEKEKNNLNSDIENTYYAYQLLKKEDWKSTKQLIRYLEKCTKKQNDMNCFEEIYLLNLQSAENIIDDLSGMKIKNIVEKIQQRPFAEQIIAYYELVDLLKIQEVTSKELEHEINKLINLKWNELGVKSSDKDLLVAYQVILYSQYKTGWDEREYLEQKIAFTNYFNAEIKEFAYNPTFFYYLCKAANDLGLLNEIEIDELKKQIALFEREYKIRNLYVDNNSDISLQRTYYISAIKELLYK